MNKYSELSRKEINRLVAMALGYDEEWLDIYPRNTPNFCNSWTDGGPIIEESKISIYFESEQAIAICLEGEIMLKAFNKSPLRAAMEVFLMMEDARNEA